MNPVVSIITPTFNHGKYIADCIESALAQTFKNWEMIIIDDGSTDSSSDIIKRYPDPRITYIRKEHRGVEFLGDNYNHALRISKGDYILILEGDDFIPVNRLELQVSSFKDSGVVLCHGKYAYVHDHKVLVAPTLFKTDILRNQPVGRAFHVFLHGFNMIGTQSVMVRKSALQQIGGFTQPSYLPLVDYPTWMKLAFLGRFEFIPEVLGFWRRHSLSITMNRSDEILNGFLRYCDDFITSYRQDLLKLGLERVIENRGAIAYLSLALTRLSNKEWGKALSLLQKSWSGRDTLSGSFKMRIVVGMVSVFLHLDLPGSLIRIRELFYQRL